MSEPFTRAQAWIDMLLLANHKTNFIRKRGVLVEVKKGQLGWSEVALSKRWQWSRGKLRRFLNELKTVQQIEQQKNNVTTLITIINYESYQEGSTAKRTPDGQQTDSKRYRNKNGKNGKNEKKETYTAEFEQFWGAYPRKANKKKAFEAWQKLNGNSPSVEELLKILEGQKKNKDWLKDGGRFIPYPSTWLNGHRWEDEATDFDEPPYWG